jgi:hypothetical protein
VECDDHALDVLVHVLYLWRLERDKYKNDSRTQLRLKAGLQSSAIVSGHNDEMLKADTIFLLCAV